MHLRPVSRSLRRHLLGRYERERDSGRGGRRSRSPAGRDRGHARDRGDRGGDRDRRRETSAERRAKIAAWNAEGGG